MMSHGQSYFVDNDKDAVRKAMLEVRPVCGTHARADGIHPVRPAPLNYSGGSEAGGPAFSRPQGGRVYGAEGPSPPGARARGPPACSGAAWPTRRCASTRGRRRTSPRPGAEGRGLRHTFFFFFFFSFFFIFFVFVFVFVFFFFFATRPSRGPAAGWQPAPTHPGLDRSMLRPKDAGLAARRAAAAGGGGGGGGGARGGEGRRSWADARRCSRCASCFLLGERAAEGGHQSAVQDCDAPATPTRCALPR